MASLINVRRDVTDNFYRYKMERLHTKIEGKGNGIKTVVVNLSTVAQSLARPGSYLIKYFGFELGAQTNIDPPDDRWIINGAHDASKLQDHLDGFINRFVLCKGCKNPETEVIIKGDLIDLDCKACGSRTEVDPRLKLSGFILKTQPKKGKKDKAERKAARRANKQAAANKDEANGGGGGSGGDDGSDQGSTEDQQPQQPAQQQTPQLQQPQQQQHQQYYQNGTENGDIDSDDELQKMAAEAPVFADSDDKEHEWAVDMSAEAVKARQAQLPAELKQKLTLADDDDDEGGGNTVYDELGTWIQDQATSKKGIDNVPSIDIYIKGKELGIESKHRTILVLVQTIFDGKICAQIPKRASMLKQFTGISERHERALLGGTERLIAEQSKEHPDFCQQIVKVLQLYYHYDLLSEEVARKWGTKASKKYVDLAVSKKIRKAAEPFLTWLDEADEEESDEDGEEEEEE